MDKQPDQLYLPALPPYPSYYHTAPSEQFGQRPLSPAQSQLQFPLPMFFSTVPGYAPPFAAPLQPQRPPTPQRVYIVVAIVICIFVLLLVLSWVLIIWGTFTSITVPTGSLSFLEQMLQPLTNA